MDFEKMQNNKEKPASELQETKPEINKEQEKKTAIEEAYKLNSELMKDKVAELTDDKKGEADPGSLLLERDTIRKKMAESGLISQQAMEGLKESYKWREFQESPLNSIKEKLGNRVSGEYAGIKEIPAEAIDLENKGMEVMRDCEGGWVRPGAFKEYFGNEIDNLKIKQIRQEIGSEKKAEELKPGFETLKKSIGEAKYDMFSRMYSHNETQLSESQKDWGRRMKEQKKDNETEKDVFERWMSGPDYSGSLNSDLEDYKFKLNRGFNRDQIRASKNINRAEITGLIGSSQAEQMRDKIEGR